MKPSETLWHILESLYEGDKRPSHDRLMGKPLKLKRGDSLILVALDTADNVHLLLHPCVDEQAERLKSLRMKDVNCAVQSLLVANEPRRSYIDISCAAKRDSLLRRPFLAFCEDVLWECDRGTAPLEEGLLSVYKRWKRFWSLPEPALAPKALVQGLWGELAVLKILISEHGPKSVSYWTGPVAPHHDFEHNGIALEVKTSVQRPPTVKINTLSQLDEGPYEALYLGVALVTSGPPGSTLSDEVRQVESLLGDDEEMIEQFYDKLAAAGYRPFNETQYAAYSFVLDSLTFYPVNPDFPRIIAGSLVRPLDRRILEVRYSLELSGLTPLQLGDPKIKKALAKLCSDPKGKARKA